MILSERDIANHYRAKRKAWLRDKQAILEGKMRPEDMSLAHQIKRGPKRQFDFSNLEAAMAKEPEDWSWLEK